MISVLGTLTLFGLVFVAAFILIALYAKVSNKDIETVLPWYLVHLLKKFGLYFAFIISLLGTTGSLYLSEVESLEPCLLCWYQRTMFYPLVLVLLVAILNNDKKVARYVVPLTLVGSLIASYHYFIQRFPEFATSCGLYSVSCTVPHFFQYGFISIPLMALAGFALVSILVLMTYYFDAKEADKTH